MELISPCCGRLLVTMSLRLNGAILIALAVLVVVMSGMAMAQTVHPDQKAILWEILEALPELRTQGSPGMTVLLIALVQEGTLLRAYQAAMQLDG